MPRARRDDEVHFGDDLPHVRADIGIGVSADGLRVRSDLANVRPLKRPRHEPEDLDDSYARWVPVPDADLGEVQAVADSVSSFDMPPEDDDSRKRKRYQSSDAPMSVWKPLDQFFLDWFLRRDGLGDYLHNPTCGLCGVVYSGTKRFFRCAPCGEFLQCEDCLKTRHQLNPLHCIKEWTGDHWTEATLSGTLPDRAGRVGVGLVYQLGHHGKPCKFPGAQRSMVVMDVRGIFSLQIRYCGCEKSEHTNNLGQLLGNAWYPATTVDPETCATFEVLDQFRLLNVVGNCNVHDFVGTLERLTDPLMTASVPYSFLLRAKRAGRGHEGEGIRKTSPGGLAVMCWACPHDGKNLPDGWKDVDAKFRFLYMLLLALDANFRLKNRLRANERQDPSLGSGLGYFVESGPYKEHLRHYVAEKDVSSCIAFAALLQKETRLTTGLRVSGVGGCVCARHGLVRPQGLGDLQKGERYANMDYIFLSSIMGVAILCLAISYDIACQWKVNLAPRAKKIAKDTPVTTSLDDLEIQYALPVWHAVAHEVSCQTENSLSYAIGVGRTDGEGIERTWAILNPIGYATKEMGDGARHDAIEDKVDRLNYEKNVKQGTTLARKLIVALAERDKQVEGFKELDSSLSSNLRKLWTRRIDDWLSDRTKPNPYCLEGGTKAGPTEAEVLAELKAAESQEAAEGRAPLSETTSTPSAFIKAGLQLEEAQRRIRAEVKGLTLVTADRSSQIQELRIALLKKLRTYERLQLVFMPGVATLRAAEEEARDGDLPAPKAENIKLWMPSDLTATQRRSGCRGGLAAVEAKLRRGQCADALGTLRSRLHAQRHIIAWRNANAAGQKSSTRSATLIGRVGDRVARVAAKYRHARTALIALEGGDYAPEFKELKDEDLSVELEEENDMASRKKMARLGSTKRSRNEPTRRKKGISWIMMIGGGPGEDEAELHDSVRVEWSKAMARRDRWVEEVKKLREEMKFVLRMLRWIQSEWQIWAEQREDVDAELAAGLRGYAARQVAVHQRIAAGFHAGWNKSVATAVRDAVREDGTIERALLDNGTVHSAPVVGLVEVEAAVAREGGDGEDGEGGNGEGEGGEGATE
ncbi:hypothetical protein B0H11DRAFT_1730986 [Mycena galericulata]|nr:hypothetical protein B0H11DRAFT_1730986 [Mycena galericulata]